MTALPIHEQRDLMTILFVRATKGGKAADLLFRDWLTQRVKDGLLELTLDWYTDIGFALHELQDIFAETHYQLRKTGKVPDTVRVRAGTVDPTTLLSVQQIQQLTDRLEGAPNE